MEGNTKSPKRCRHGAMRYDNPYVGMRKKNSKQAASWEAASWKLKKLDKK